MNRIWLGFGFCIVLAACSTQPIKPSDTHIKPGPAPSGAIPKPVTQVPPLPAPTPAPKTELYSVSVVNVPVQEILFALARDARLNVDIHQGISGNVTLNAIDQSLPQILSRISKQVDMRYEIHGQTIAVMPDTPYLRNYKIDYVNMSRDTSGEVAISAQISGTSTSTSGAGTGSGTTTTTAFGSNNTSSTKVINTAKNRFWETLIQNVKDILRETDKVIVEGAEPGTTHAATAAGGPSGAGGVPPDLAPAAARRVTFREASSVIANPESGVITVRATSRQHERIQEFLDSVAVNAKRQVLIEATIVEVQLSNNYQAGIDWSRVSQSGGIAFTQALLGSNLATAPFFALFYNQNNQREGQVQLTVKLLEQFGNTRVLSSPKLMALNNQTALLKVVDNVVYFEIKSDTSQQQTSSLTTVTTTPKTVAVGVVMGVTPQVGDDNRVSLTVRPTITRLNPQQPFVFDPNPTLCDVNRTNCLQNPVPQVQTREMESVLQVANGQVVVLGGLMQDESQRSRDQVPFLGNVPDVGEALAFRNDQVTKSELVIFLRTTIVTNPTLASDELKFFQRFLPKPETPPDLSSVPEVLRPPPGDILPQPKPADAAQ